MSIADVLDKAADLIEPEGRWIKGDFAHNAKGENTGLTEYRGPAVCWCALGAIYKAANGDEELDEVAVQVVRDLLGRDVDNWNDAPERTQPEVVARLREAATVARERGL